MQNAAVTTGLPPKKHLSLLLPEPHRMEIRNLVSERDSFRVARGPGVFGRLFVNFRLAHNAVAETTALCAAGAFKQSLQAGL